MRQRIPSLKSALSIHRPLLLAAAIGTGCGALTADANVFASHVRLDGVTTNLTTTPGSSVTIEYLLNQAADAGVTVSVAVGTNVVWSTNLTGATGGTNRGLNSVVWNGRDASGNIVSNGQWQVRITAASAGATNWTKLQLKDNTIQTLNGDGYVWSPQGIAVNNNINSPWFGRVYVGNTEANEPVEFAGDLVGVAKYNADGSHAEEGAHSTGGWSWAGDGSSPWKIEVGADDRVYVVDGADSCVVLSFDALISTNAPSLLALEASNALSPAVKYRGMALTGTGPGRKIYMSDTGPGSPGEGVGVRRWDLQAWGATATNDAGETVVSTSPALGLDRYPQDVAVDSSGHIFVIQNIPGISSSARLLAYPAYQSNALTVATWTVDDGRLIEASGVATAVHTNWLAVVCRQDVGYAISLFNRDSGAPVNSDGLNSGATYEHDYTDVAWDRAGNLYVTDWQAARWRVFSPPGANQFSTTSIQTIKVGPYIHPTLHSLQWQGSQLQLQLTGEPGVTYVIEATTNLLAWSGVATNKATAETSNWTVPAPASKGFFRARALP